MRRTVLFLFAIFLVGCSQASRQAPTPAPLDWYLKNGMDPLPVGSCPFPAVEQELLLAGVRPAGLDAHGWWRPGFAQKVNWVAEDTSGQMSFTLTSVSATPRRQFILDLTLGPSVIQFPGPGCWELTMKVGGRDAQLFIPIRPDRPAYLGALSNQPHPPAGLFQTNKHLEELLRLIASGKDEAKPSQDPPSWWLTLVWEHTGQTPLRFFEGGVLEVPKSLVTGNCRDSAQTLFRKLPSELAKQIEQDLNTLVRVPGDQNRFTFSGQCSIFQDKSEFA